MKHKSTQLFIIVISLLLTSATFAQNPLISFDIDGLYGDDPCGPFMFESECIPYEQFKGVSAITSFKWLGTNTVSHPLTENLDFLNGTDGITMELDGLQLYAFRSINTEDPAGSPDVVGERGDDRFYINGSATVFLDEDAVLVIKDIWMFNTNNYPTPEGTGEECIGAITGYGVGKIDYEASSDQWVTEFDPNGTGTIKFYFDSFSPVEQVVATPSCRDRYAIYGVSNLRVFPADYNYNYQFASLLANDGMIDLLDNTSKIKFDFNQSEYNSSPDEFGNRVVAGYFNTNPGGAAPNGINEIFGGGYWYTGSTLFSYNADLYFDISDALEQAGNIDAIRIISREREGAEWQIEENFSKVGEDVIRVSGVERFKEFAIGLLALPPKTPILIAPLDNTDKLWYNPRLEWETDVPAIFRFQIADNEGFDNPVADGVTGAEAVEGSFQLTPAYELEDSTTYYWRIKATNDIGSSEWSEIFSFTTSDLNWEKLPKLVVNDRAVRMESVYFTSENNGAVVGGEIRKTEDGGKSWIYQTVLNGNYPMDITSPDHDNLFVCAGPVILKNSGTNTWEIIETGLDAAMLNSIVYAGMNTMYSAGGLGDVPIIIKSTDGGTNWEILEPGVQGFLEDISFYGAFNGIAVGREGLILRTEDGGETWENISLNVPGDHDITTVAYISQNTILVGVENSGLFKSVDNGDTWERNEVSVPVNSFIKDIHFIDANNGFVSYSSNNGYQPIFRTTDGGKFWGLQNSHAMHRNMDLKYATVEKLHFPYHGLGYAVGDDGCIIKYKYDSPIKNDENPVVSIGEVNASPGDTVLVPVIIDLPSDFGISSAELSFTGFIDAEFLSVETGETLAGSEEWLFEYNDMEQTLYTAFAGAEEITGKGVLCYLRFFIPESFGEGTIPVLFDNVTLGKQHYNIDKYNGGINVFPLLYGDADGDGEITAEDGSYILKYIAGTVPAEEFDSVSADVSLDGSISALDASLVLQYIVKLIEELPYTEFSDEGTADFNMNDLALEPGAETIDVPVYINNASGIFGFLATVEYDTTKLVFEGIANWSEGLDSAFKQVKDADGIINLAGAMTKQKNLEDVFVSLRFSVNGLNPANKTEVKLSSLRINENAVSTGLASSEIKYVTSVENESNIPDNFEMAQNYPNPFNPSTTISFGLPEAANVKITVYNSLGQETAELVNKSYNAGRYEVNFDASSLASGIYYYRIQAGSFTSVRKMILLK